MPDYETLKGRQPTTRPAGKDFLTNVPHNLVMAAQRILVVDDDPIVREVLGRYLDRDGFDVDVAEDGEAAVEA